MSAVVPPRSTAVPPTVPGSLVESFERAAPALWVHCANSLPHAAERRLLERRTDYYASFGERALLLTGEADVVCLHQRPEPAFLAFLAHLGLGAPPERVVAPPSGARHPHAPLAGLLLADPAALARMGALLPRDGEAWLCPLMPMEDDIRLAGMLAQAEGGSIRVLGGRPEAAARCNLKHLTREVALELGVPVAPGEVVELDLSPDGHPRDLAPVADAIARVARRTGRALVRGAVSGGGSSVFVASWEDRGASTLAEIARRTGNRLYLVEEMLNLTVSPNVQAFIDPSDGTVSCVTVTDQRLGADLRHVGNAFPSEARTLPDMIHWTLVLARWLAGEGLTGLVGFDFVEYTEPDCPAPLAALAEVNPRVNAATYPWAAMERLNRRQQVAGRPLIGGFASGSISTAARSFAELAQLLGPRLFDPTTGRGLVPYRVSTLREGRCLAVAFAGTREEAEDDLRAVEHGEGGGEADR